MKLDGKTWSQYIAFVKGPLFLLTLAFAARWGLSAMGVPPNITRYLSMTAVSIAIVVYLPLKIHTRRFGSYSQLGVLYLIIAAWINLLIVAAILVAAGTGRDNVYSLDDIGRSTSPGAHILAHLTLGIGMSTLLNFAIGSLVLYLLRRYDTAPKPTSR